MDEDLKDVMIFSSWAAGVIIVGIIIGLLVSYWPGDCPCQ